MERLREQHKRVIIGVITLSASAAVGLPSLVGLLLGGPVSPLFAQVVAGVMPLLGGAAVFFYERKGWRMLNPQLDLSGPWVFRETQFTVDEGGARKIYGVAWGVIHITQSVRRIYIHHAETVRGAMPATLQAAETLLAECDVSREAIWHSRAMELSEKGDVLYLCFEHESTNAAATDLVRYGVEVMSIVPNSTSRTPPTRMTSAAHHCVGSGTPRTIDCHYERGSLADFYERQNARLLKADPQAPLLDGPSDALPEGY